MRLRIARNGCDCHLRLDVKVTYIEPGQHGEVHFPQGPEITDHVST